VQDALYTIIVDQVVYITGDSRTVNKSGYFSSKRDGGKGDDDVYYFTLN
jgi:hypothetical protein